MPARALYTVGHSTRTLDELIAILRAHAIELLVDVRTLPRSRRHPHFDQASLARALPEAGIEYRHMKALGGLRKRQPGVDPATNAGWRVDAFHNYADYARGPEFRAALDELLAAAARQAAAVMCAEAVWFRCHRRLIADHALARGWEVRHIVDASRWEPGALHELAVVEPDGRIAYPARQGQLLPAAPPTGDDKIDG